MTLDAALAYRRRSWGVLPIPRGQKRPILPAWQSLRLAEEEIPAHFGREPTNLGVLLGSISDGLVDVDLDCAEARRLATTFLPRTGSVFGRPGSARSHWLYYAGPLVKTTKYQDPVKGDGGHAMIVEIRSTGAQTIFPPSTHPSGEQIAWDQDGEPERLDGAILRARVGCLAAAALLGRHWPATGSRQDAALALAGGLLRASWTVDEVAEFLAAVGTVAGDDETAKRATAAEYTARRIHQDSPATGWPTLAALIGAAVVERVTDWLDIKRQAEPATLEPAPVPVPVQMSSAPAPAVRAWPAPIDGAAYHGIAGDVVRAIDPHSEADPVAILVTFLTVAGNVIGRGAYALAEADQHGCNLFACLVGPSAKARKGASWGRIREIVERVDSRWLSERVGGGLSSGEGLINAVRDPVRKGELVVEEGVDDKRWLAQESEMGSVLKRSIRDGNTLSDILRIAWDGGTLRTLTKGSPLKATRAHISILGHITRDDLLKHLNDTEVANGFANRFLWCAVRRSKELPEGGGEVELNSIVERLHDAVERARTLGRIQRDPTARAIWADVYHHLSADKPGLLGAVTARAEAQVLRLSVLYAALDGSHVITDAHLLAGLAVWEYAERSARWIFGDAIGDVLADRILDALRQVPEGLAKSAIHALLGRNQAAARVDGALGTLLSLGRVRREMQDAGHGRPQEVWMRT